MRGRSGHEQRYVAAHQQGSENRSRIVVGGSLVSQRIVYERLWRAGVELHLAVPPNPTHRRRERRNPVVPTVSQPRYADVYNSLAVCRCERYESRTAVRRVVGLVGVRAADVGITHLELECFVDSHWTTANLLQAGAKSIQEY